jgi:hypothetical protein
MKYYLYVILTFFLIACKKEAIVEIIPPFKSGIISPIPDNIFSAIPYEEDLSKRTKGTEALPSVFKLPFIEDLIHQNLNSECVPVAGALLMTYYMNQQGNYDNNHFPIIDITSKTDVASLSFIEAIIDQEFCEEGTYLSRVLDCMKNQGDCFWTTMPSDGKSCEYIANNFQKDEAKKYKISKYYRLPIVDMDVTAIKRLLALKKKPILVHINMGDGINGLHGTKEIWKPSKKLGEANEGGHAMIITGYDDINECFVLSHGNYNVLLGYDYLKNAIYRHEIVGFDTDDFEAFTVDYDYGNNNIINDVQIKLETTTYTELYKHYELYSLSSFLNWKLANLFAKSLGGYLYVPNSKQENDTILNRLLNHPKASGDIPLGISDVTEEGKFETSPDKKGLTFSNWAINEPNNHLGCGAEGEDFVQILSLGQGIERKWNDAPGEGNCGANRYNAIIVEYDK